MFVLLRVPTVKIFSFTSINLELYIYYIIDRFVYERMLCKVTYVCALCESSHLDFFF